MKASHQTTEDLTHQSRNLQSIFTYSPVTALSMTRMHTSLTGRNAGWGHLYEKGKTVSESQRGPKGASFTISQCSDCILSVNGAHGHWSMVTDQWSVVTNILMTMNWPHGPLLISGARLGRKFLSIAMLEYLYKLSEISETPHYISYK